jgi:hypothetical protein
LCAKVEDGLITLEARARSGRLGDPAKIDAAADRVLRDSGVGRCFTTTVKEGRFSWDFDEMARRYDEELLCGRYPGQGASSLRRGYFRLEQGRNHLSWANRSRVVETPSSRAPIYPDLRD